MLDRVCKDLCRVKEVSFSEVLILYNILVELFKQNKKYDLAIKEDEYFFRDKMFVLADSLKKQGFDNKKVELFLKAVGYYYSF